MFHICSHQRRNGEYGPANSARMGALVRGEKPRRDIGNAQPDGLSPAEQAKFERAVYAASDAALAAELQAGRRALEELANLAAQSVAEVPEPMTEPASPRPPLVIPEGNTDVLLDR